MKRSRLFLLAATLLVLAALCGYETQVLHRQRRQLDEVRRQAGRSADALAPLRRANAALARELTEAERQLVQLPARRTLAEGASPEQERELSQWLARIKRLRQLFEENPGYRIPEMRFLTDQDWLRATRHARFDTDEERREALAEVRGAAIGHFISELQAAMQKYARTATRDTPPDIMALAPYLPSHADLLSRYTMTISDRKNLGGAYEWKIEANDAVDQDYDNRYYARVSSDGNIGGGSMKGVFGWIPNLYEQVQQATQAYIRTNQRPPPGDIIEILPFFNPPLDPATTARVMKAMARSRK